MRQRVREDYLTFKATVILLADLPLPLKSALLPANFFFKQEVIAFACGSLGLMSTEVIEPVFETATVALNGFTSLAFKVEGMHVLSPSNFLFK